MEEEERKLETREAGNRTAGSEGRRGIRASGRTIKEEEIRKSKAEEEIKLKIREAWNRNAGTGGGRGNKAMDHRRGNRQEGSGGKRGKKPINQRSRKEKSRKGRNTKK